MQLKSILPGEIESWIITLRSRKVMLDHDLAKLYGVSTKVLNQAVRRNARRFPADFMFQLSEKEKDELVTNCDRLASLKHSSSMPYAFTELGVAMLSSVLSSEKAIQVNIRIMRTFVRIKDTMLAHKDLWVKMDAMEKKYDKQFQVVFKAIKMLLDKPKEEPPKRF